MFKHTQGLEKRVWFLIDPRISIPMYMVLILSTPQEYRAYWYLIWFVGCVTSSLLGPPTINGSERSPENARQYIFQQLGFSFVYWLTIAGLITAAIDNLFL
jgi:hypothetical protein